VKLSERSVNWHDFRPGLQEMMIGANYLLPSRWPVSAAAVWPAC